MLYMAENGIKLRNQIYSLIHSQPELEKVVLDMAGIESIDSSFCREGFVKIISLLQTDTERPQLIFINATDNVRNNLHDSFTGWDKTGIVKTSDSKTHIIGKQSPHLFETLKVMLKLKEARTKDIATHLDNLPLTTLNNRMKSLYEMCVISRKEVIQGSGGKEYLYCLDIE